MNFKHSCFTKNTPEAREWLEWIGMWCDDKKCCDPYLLTLYGAYCSCPTENITFYYETHTDCCGNLPLFKALTAVREDSDYMQWFTDGKEWDLCNCNSFATYLYSEYDGLCSEENIATYHKATKEEIIEHFK